MKRRPWTEADDAQLAELRQRMSGSQIARVIGRSRAAVLQRAYKLGLQTPPHIAESTRRKPGQEPWNKGRRYQPGGRCAETQFQPGHTRSTQRPIGSVYQSDGYLMVKVSDDRDLPLQAFSKPARWRALHYLVWEAERGPVPEGMHIRFINGVRTDCRIENLELTTAAEKMVRNSYHGVDDPEYRSITMLRASLTRKVKALIKQIEDKK